jgi:hypothetical protein
MMSDAGQPLKFDVNETKFEHLKPANEIKTSGPNGQSFTSNSETVQVDAKVSNCNVENCTKTKTSDSPHGEKRILENAKGCVHSDVSKVNGDDQKLTHVSQTPLLQSITFTKK